MRCWLPCSGPVWSCFSRFCMVGVSRKLQTPPAIVADDKDVKRRAADQRQAFQDRYGYPAVVIPDIWRGQTVSMNVLGSGGKDNPLGPVNASGMLEAVRYDGCILSPEDRVVFLPREVALRLELVDSDRRGA
jgi:hypothetical protein